MGATWDPWACGFISNRERAASEGDQAIRMIRSAIAFEIALRERLPKLPDEIVQRDVTAAADFAGQQAEFAAHFGRLALEGE